MAEKVKFFSKVKAKAENIWNKYGHWIVIGGIFITGATIGGLMMRDCVSEDERRRIRLELQPDYDSMYRKARRDAEYDLAIKRLLEKNDEDEDEEEEDNGLWTEEQRDSWDEICECVSKLDILPDEEYHIVSGDVDCEDGVKIGKNYICHTIEGTGSYPPDCEAYIDADWEEDDEEDEEDTDIPDDEEDEDDDDNCLKIKISKDASDDVRQLVEDFIDIVENGDITVTHF